MQATPDDGRCKCQVEGYICQFNMLTFLLLFEYDCMSPVRDVDLINGISIKPVRTHDSQANLTLHFIISYQIQ